MKAGAVEYRLRYWIHGLIYTLGFFSPWEILLRPSLPRTSTWLDLAAWPARQGWMSFSASTVALLVFGILMATAGALLRTWGGAYLGAGIVQSGAMHGDRVLADGPYRRVRNPLYLGTFLHTLAVALLMPESGAIFTILAIGLFQLRLILREEPFLREKLGAPYTTYCARVPRLLPALTPRVDGAGERPHWPQAFLAEIYFWAVAVAFLTLGWRYNAFLLLKGVVVAVGLQMITRGLARPTPQPAT